MEEVCLRYLNIFSDFIDLQRLHQAGYPMLMLETQYRMHPEISYFPSQQFYQGRLQNDPRMAPIYRKNEKGFKGSHWKPYHEDSSKKYSPLVWHDFYIGKEEVSGTSYCNQEEVNKFNSATHFTRLSTY